MFVCLFVVDLFVLFVYFAFTYLGDYKVPKPLPGDSKCIWNSLIRYAAYRLRES